ncbi:MAG TPA: ABC transporter permease [Thermoanaerobaculia bacterium]|nr:ABC transporter permease [Thermoanaerobaculia bacterium]
MLATARLLINEVFFALRRMRRSAASSLVCILGLGLASGSVAAAFSIFDRVFLRTPPFPEAESLVTLAKGGAIQRSDDLPPTVAPWLGECPALASVGLFNSGTVNFAFRGRAVRLRAAQVSGEFFSTLGVAALRGRVLGRSDVRPRREPVVVVSQGLWRQLGPADVSLGEPVSIGGYPFSIVGVMPDGFEFPKNTDLWVPVSSLGSDQLFTGALVFEFVGRLAPGQSVASAQTQLSRCRTGDNSPASPAVTLMPIQRYLFEQVRPVSLWLQIAALMVLGVAAFNVVTLQAAEDDHDRTQTAVRMALGAPRHVLQAQRLARYMWVALMGSAAGLGCGSLIVRVLARWAPAADWLGSGSGLSVRAGAAVVLACGLSTLLAAALVRSPIRASLVGELRTGGLAVSRTPATAGSRWMLVFEVALATGLLFGMGSLASAFRRMLAVASGLNPQEVVTAQISLVGPRYDGSLRRSQALERILVALRSLPNVTRAGATNSLPFALSSDMGTAVRAEGTPWREDDPDKLIADLRVVTPDYFPALGIEFLAGRDFVAADATSYRSVIVNRRLAERFGGPAGAIGRRLLFDDGSDGSLEVIGVVGDVRHRGLEAAPELEAYFPVSAQYTPSVMTLTVSSAGTAGSVAGSIRSVLRKEDPEVAVELRSLASVISASQQSRSFAVFLVTFFACTAAILSGIGVFAVFRDSVLRRRREFAIRLALGSSPRRIREYVFAQALGRGTLGVGLGVWIGIALYRAIQAALPTGAEPSLVVAVAMPILMYVVIGLAVYLPARHASRTDAAELLRS